MLFGYARVSTQDQNADLQIRALLKYGVKEKNIITEKISGTTSKRKKLENLIKILRDGDTLVVWKLDRLARSLIHFNTIINELNKNNVKFKSITESFIDTTSDSAQAKFIVNIFAALAELERDIISERTLAGLDSARKRGKILGPPKGISKKNKAKARLCAVHFKEGVLTVDEICYEVGVSRGTYYKYIEHEGLKGKVRKYKKKYK